jgi:Uncharacterized conserved protein
MELVEGTATIGDIETFLEELAEIEDAHDAVVQAVDARYVVDRHHLELATKLASRERARDAGIARNPGVEILLYAAGRRQINRALEMGVTEGTEQPVVVVVVGGEELPAVKKVRERITPGNVLGTYDRERVEEFFQITETELAATADAGRAGLVHERVALLVAER